MKKIGRKGVPGSKWYMKKKSETYDTFWKGQAVKCDEGRGVGHATRVLGWTRSCKVSSAWISNLIL